MSRSPVPECADSNQNSSLTPGFKQRHVTMISIAGVIGAGLFVASGRAIASAGPAAIIAYLVAGILVVLVMRMLGEMAVASPDTGSFSTYADRAIGHWAGFTIGWLYWWFWVLVVPLEAIAAGDDTEFILPVRRSLGVLAQYYNAPDDHQSVQRQQVWRI